MKKARILLLVICLCSLVAGAYAYKAQKTSIVVYTRALNTTICIVTLRGYSTTAQLPGQFSATITFASSVIGACPITIELYTAP
jgi:hypothetical protein